MAALPLEQRENRRKHKIIMKIPQNSNASLLIVFSFINMIKEMCKYTVFYKNAQNTCNVHVSREEEM